MAEVGVNFQLNQTFSVSFTLNSFIFNSNFICFDSKAEEMSDESEEVCHQLYNFVKNKVFICVTGGRTEAHLRTDR